MRSASVSSQSLPETTVSAATLTQCRARPHLQRSAHAAAEAAMPLTWRSCGWHLEGCIEDGLGSCLFCLSHQHLAGREGTG
jgi:hypothetical protein